jgi:hypothetical protein
VAGSISVATTTCCSTTRPRSRAAISRAQITSASALRLGIAAAPSGWADDGLQWGKLPAVISSERNAAAIADRTSKRATADKAAT